MREELYSLIVAWCRQWRWEHGTPARKLPWTHNAQKAQPRQPRGTPSERADALATIRETRGFMLLARWEHPKEWADALSLINWRTFDLLRWAKECKDFNESTGDLFRKPGETRRKTWKRVQQEREHHSPLGYAEYERITKAEGEAAALAAYEREWRKAQ